MRTGDKLGIGAFRGVGPKKAEYFKKLSIVTAADVLYSFPRDYENRSNQKQIGQLEQDETAFVKAQVASVKKGPYRAGRKQTLRMLVRDETGRMEVLFFNAGYMSRSVRAGDLLWFFGKVSFSSGQPQMVHPQWGKAESREEKEAPILPVYPLTEGVSQNDRRNLAAQVLETAEREAWLSEFLPEETLGRNQLCGIQYALHNIHFPLTQRQQLVSKYRLIFEEFMVMQAGLSLMRNRISMEKQGISFDPGIKIVSFLDSLPFSLTKAQKRTVDEVIKDMESERVMYRLIQGDVGCGKTVVAAAAVYKAVCCGYQAVLMAPTEILAKQHFETFRQLFEDPGKKDRGISVGFLSGSLTAKQRQLTLSRLKAGEIQILIGTHALIRPDVVFQNLGLVVTDEQHRFGVAQRQLLNEKGENCDTLIMTATPIPRTLALTLYGDLDISMIDEKPQGRREVKTAAFEMKDRILAYRFLYRELKKGRQGYVVAPLIETTEGLEVRSAEGIFRELKEKFSDFSVALLHGKMKQGEKEAIMEDFRRGSIQILVSTVVIEVGINVPNATVMIIENAERFGLAQMHQLRGRVGRGSEQSYCMLISALQTDVARQRAQTMVKTTDGFQIAEMDLVLRGPGEFFGLRQHGMPELKIADLARHTKILKAASDEVKLLLRQDPLLEKPEHIRLREEAERRFQTEEISMS